MSKKRFIQAVVVRRLPPLAELPNTIRYAEQAWDGLTRHGYGDAAEGKPRESKNWYAELTPRQQRWFDTFWEAFSHKQGKTNAAGRWHQLGELTDAEYQAIVDAADAEAKRQLPKGQARKMAQGWLFEMRWIDYAKPQTVADGTRRKAEINRLRSDIAGLQQLYDAKPNEALKRQLDGKMRQLESLKTEVINAN